MLQLTFYIQLLHLPFLYVPCFFRKHHFILFLQSSYMLTGKINWSHVESKKGGGGKVNSCKGIKVHSIFPSNDKVFGVESKCFISCPLDPLRRPAPTNTPDPASTQHFSAASCQWPRAPNVHVLVKRNSRASLAQTIPQAQGLVHLGPLQVLWKPEFVCTPRGNVVDVGQCAVNWKRGGQNSSLRMRIG